jgi:phosphoribosylpyrophosphate synthetase
MFPGYPQIICDKIRDGNSRNVVIKEGDPRGYHVVIVDDLVISGGTTNECKKVLFANGAAAVSAYVTHPAFPQKSWKRFIERDPEGLNFSNFWITDSCPNTVSEIFSYNKHQGHGPFEVLSLVDPLLEMLS